MFGGAFLFPKGRFSCAHRSEALVHLISSTTATKAYVLWMSLTVLRPPPLEPGRLNLAFLHNRSGQEVLVLTAPAEPRAILHKDTRQASVDTLEEFIKRTGAFNPV
jgi:hypothetical protein